jgi:hypothetical protein
MQWTDKANRLLMSYPMRVRADMRVIAERGARQLYHAGQRRILRVIADDIAESEYQYAREHCLPCGKPLA